MATGNKCVQAVVRNDINGHTIRIEPRRFEDWRSIETKGFLDLGIADKRTTLRQNRARQGNKENGSESNNASEQNVRSIFSFD
ncbi:hypothetical protein TH8_14790 [Thalassospira profundimaris]|nr:hypothetical protein TH8_14790 [Thalassospira profundimaris]